MALLHQAMYQMLNQLKHQRYTDCYASLRTAGDSLDSNV